MKTARRPLKSDNEMKSMFEMTRSHENLAKFEVSNILQNCSLVQEQGETFRALLFSFLNVGAFH